MTNSLAVAELAIYALLAVPVIYLLVRHWPAGLLGWFYLFAFCSIRVVGGAMSMNENNASASIISNVGLSPLILATSGILHEGSVHRGNLNRKLEWTFIAFFHVLVATGIALLAAGASSLQQMDPSTSNNSLSLVKIGIGLLAASWAILCAWIVMLLLSPSQQNMAQSTTYREGTMLLYCVAFSVIFVGIRVWYSLAALVSQDPSLNQVTGSLAIRVVLSFLPELIVAVAFIVAGFLTQNVARAGKTQRSA